MSSNGKEDVGYIHNYSGIIVLKTVHSMLWSETNQYLVVGGHKDGALNAFDHLEGQPSFLGDRLVDLGATLVRQHDRLGLLFRGQMETVHHHGLHPVRVVRSGGFVQLSS